ncbi:MAG: substrate-binding domain-containing protein [Firmicutes bacterium]|nr:substrate-binding domain-containing protein [Bacillota bacterium]
MKNTKKILSLLLALAMVVTLAACGNKDGESKESSSEAPASSAAESSSEAPKENTAMEGTINVISREEGSGTRGAFVEITGVQKDKEDMTKADAAIQNGTDQVITYVASDAKSIGYISLGSLNDTVKAVKINDVEATEENVINDSYALKRPFNIAYKAEEKDNEVVADFMKYIMSKEGQALAGESGVIAADSSAAAYEKAKDLKGEIRIQGSTSVTPYMEKLMEAYKKVQPGVTFDFTSNGSGAGIQAVIDGNANIGMASREIKDEEKKAGVESTVIAIDGIAVIVAPDNACESLTLDQVRQIYTDEITDWANLGK